MPSILNADYPNYSNLSKGSKDFECKKELIAIKDKLEVIINLLEKRNGKLKCSLTRPPEREEKRR